MDFISDFKCKFILNRLTHGRGWHTVFLVQLKMTSLLATVSRNFCIIQPKLFSYLCYWILSVQPPDRKWWTYIFFTTNIQILFSIMMTLRWNFSHFSAVQAQRTPMVPLQFPGNKVNAAFPTEITVHCPKLLPEVGAWVFFIESWGHSL